MRKVISNTTPILSLLKIGQLSLLEEIYSVIVVPTAVWQEIEAGRDKSYYCDLTKLPWIKIQSVKNPTAVLQLADLDPGEAEVLVLASEINADLVIIDEALGRFHAKRLGLSLTGTLGVLLRAKQQGIVAEVKPLLKALRTQGIWISDRVM